MAIGAVATATPPCVGQVGAACATAGDATLGRAAGMAAGRFGVAAGIGATDTGVTGIAAAGCGARVTTAALSAAAFGVTADCVGCFSQPSKACALNELATALSCGVS